MRSPVNLKRGSLRLNMTPMIDVVFLLIIFFLVSSHLARQEVQAELSLPAADTGEESPETDLPRVFVNIVPEKDEYVIKLGTLPVRPAELGRRLAEERKKEGHRLEVRIRADRSVPYEIVEPVMLACAQSGIWNVTFAVIKREDMN